MRLLVGTLHTIENEFEECCAGIRGQSYDRFDHVVIRNLPNREAHETLYRKFMQESETYDILVKVDADMVIEDRRLFEKIVEKFESDPELDQLLIAVHDFFTDGLLIGMNIFRNTVRWDLGSEELFTDRTHRGETIRKTVKDFSRLAPAALHCPNPSAFQAFHYGFHRGMKAVRGGKNWSMLVSLFEHYKRDPDLRLAYAMLGANSAFSGRFTIENISYTDDTLKDYFEERYAGNDPEELHRDVRRSRLFWWFRLPIDRRIFTKYYRLKERVLGAVRR